MIRYLIKFVNNKNLQKKWDYHQAEQITRTADQRGR
jgi:hypothetical protein